MDFKAMLSQIGLVKIDKQDYLTPQGGDSTEGIEDIVDAPLDAEDILELQAILRESGASEEDIATVK